MFNRKKLVSSLSELIVHAANHENASPYDILACLGTITLGFFDHFEGDPKKMLQEYYAELSRAQEEALKKERLENLEKKENNDNRGKT